MNDALRAAAEDLLEYLLWMANDSLVMQKIPTCDPNTDENCGPDAQVRTLQAFYQPHERLPEPGQAIYRELQGLVDLRFCDPRPGTHTPADDLVRCTHPADHVGENVWNRPCGNGSRLLIAVDQQARSVLRGEGSARDGGRDGRVPRSIQQPAVG